MTGNAKEKRNLKKCHTFLGKSDIKMSRKQKTNDTSRRMLNY